MAIATFKDLCIDATDAGALGAFWAEMLGLELHHQDNGDAYLTGPTEQHTIWVNRVPEPKTVKHRAHFDVTGSVATAEALGATVVAEQSHWTVMTDPEGGEFCVLDEGLVHGGPLYAVTTDTDGDRRSIAEWYGELLDGTVKHHDEWSAVSGVAGAPFAKLLFMQVPEPKTVKNRVHVDLTTSDVALLEKAGATVLRPQDDEIRWTVMADPDGNEFCAFVR